MVVQVQEGAGSASVGDPLAGLTHIARMIAVELDAHPRAGRGTWAPTVQGQRQLASDRGVPARITRRRGERARSDGVIEHGVAPEGTAVKVDAPRPDARMKRAQAPEPLVDANTCVEAILSEAVEVRLASARP